MRPLMIAIAALLAATPALAADAITVPVSSAAVAVPIAEGDSGFSWTGFYAGIYGVAQSGPVSGSQFGGGINVGVNAQFDFFLVGGEVAFQGLAGGAGATSYGQVVAKGGIVVSDDLAIYGAAGYGIDTGAPVEDHLLVGGGLELAVTDDVSLKAQYLHGFPITGANPVEQVSVGANFHF